MFWLGRLGDSFYVSPEMALNRPHGKASDVWGLGVLLHILLSGTQPFLGTGESLRYAICNGELHVSLSVCLVTSAVCLTWSFPILVWFFRLECHQWSCQRFTSTTTLCRSQWPTFCSRSVRAPLAQGIISFLKCIELIDKCRRFSIKKGWVDYLKCQYVLWKCW